MKQFATLFLLLSLVACNSGGGGAKSSGSTPIPNNNPIPDTDPDIYPSCFQAAATTTAQGAPFHAIGRRSGINFYLICNATQFAALANNSNFYSQYFELGTDIDLYNYYTGDYVDGPIDNQFMIAPNASSPFKGSLEGNGYTVSDFRLFNTNSFCGVFGYLENAAITNIEFESIRISSSSGTCGALAGRAKNSLIYNTVLTYENLSELNIPFEQWAFVSGPKVAGFIAELDNSVIDTSYSVVNLDTRSISSAQLSGFSLNMINSSFISNSFYDGVAQFDSDAIKAGVTLISPVYVPASEDDTGDFKLLDIVAVSTQSNLGDLCGDDANCKSDSVFSVNKSNNPNYYSDDTSLIYSNWSLFIWDFNVSSEFPYPRLE